jgi:hypothetical protein
MGRCKRKYERGQGNFFNLILGELGTGETIDQDRSEKRPREEGLDP